MFTNLGHRIYLTLLYTFIYNYIIVFSLRVVTVQVKTPEEIQDFHYHVLGYLLYKTCLNWMKMNFRENVCVYKFVEQMG